MSAAALQLRSDDGNGAGPGSVRRLLEMVGTIRTTDPDLLAIPKMNSIQDSTDSRDSNTNEVQACG